MERRKRDEILTQGILNKYSISFKRRVVEEVESGLLTSAEARRMYRIPGKATVGDWIKKYGVNERINKAVYVMTREEEHELLQLRKDNRRLQQALDDSQIKNLALESLIELAEEQYHLGLKKNYGAQVLKELRRRLTQPDSEPELD